MGADRMADSEQKLQATSSAAGVADLSGA